MKSLTKASNLGLYSGVTVSTYFGILMPEKINGAYLAQQY